MEDYKTKYLKAISTIEILNKRILQLEQDIIRLSRSGTGDYCPKCNAHRIMLRSKGIGLCDCGEIPINK